MLRFCILFVLICDVAQAQVLEGRARVVDGDTLRLAGQTIRLHGIDAPEMDQTCQKSGRSWNCGRWSAAQLRRIAKGVLRCEGRERDRYGRLVATCFRGTQDLNAAMVERGAAFAYRRYALDYVDAEKRAAISERGLWASQVTLPETFRAAQRVQPAPPPGDCVIKGNISASGHIYHSPGQRDYAQTSIRTDKGERWFCTAAEAEQAGWRPARR